MTEAISNNTTEYLFMIYSCKKNLERAEIIYARINEKIKNCKVYIVYGIKNIDSVILADKYLVLNVEDDYDHLNMKTLLLLQTVITMYAGFPHFKGMFKCDDDMWININNINTFIDENSRQQNAVNYAGFVAKYTPTAAANVEHLPPNFECAYCGGPLYYLSKKSVDCFESTNLKEKAFIPIYYEDVMVGKHLNHNNIYPVKAKKKEGWSQLYCDYIDVSHSISYHNNKHHRDLSIIIQGGIGNQLFQLACGMKMAKKYNKRFVLNVNGIISNPHQQHNRNRTLTTLQKLCPSLVVVDEQLDPAHYHLFKETGTECFLAPMEKLEHAFYTYANIALHGYFIHSAYLPTVLEATLFTDIPRHLTPTNTRLHHQQFANTYFLHIRLGDFLNHPMYQIELKLYYNYCIQQITRQNPQARFYICTNQYDMILQKYIKNFPQRHPTDPQRPIEYILQEQTNDEVDTLYIMSSCQGAICTNSTLSYMGAFFQTLKRIDTPAQQHTPEQIKETIYMPYPYVRFLNGFNETNVTTSMYPDWCTIYNTLNNTVITKAAAT